ncbi:MAG: cytochrome c [Thermomicrobiales bacterium]
MQRLLSSKNWASKRLLASMGPSPMWSVRRSMRLRDVHLPHGYDGVPAQRGQELAKAVQELPGPIYIHCHHGKHRSPAAAAVACIAAGLLEPAGAEAILKTAGTSENYRGLFQSAREARPLDAEVLKSLESDFPETAKIPPLAEAMVALEHTHDHLKQIAANQWKPLLKHPDLEPAHEALLLREHFTEMLRLELVAKKPADFRRYSTESETAAEELEKELRESAALEKINASFAKINKACVDCHKQFRDVPLSEKGE